MVEISREIAERFVMMSLIQLFALIEVNNIINKNQKGCLFSHFPCYQTEGTNKCNITHIRRKRNGHENTCNINIDILT